MTALSPSDRIAAGETISVFFGGVLGPLTGADTVAANIAAAFDGTNFRLQAVHIPAFSEFEAPDVVGSFAGYDGSNSLPGRNMTEAEAENFFATRLKTVPGLYFSKINSIHRGALNPSGFSLQTWAIGGAVLIALIAVAVIAVRA